MDALQKLMPTHQDTSRIANADLANASAELIARGNALLSRLEACLPPAASAIDWHTTWACRWRKTSGLLSNFAAGQLIPITALNCPPWSALSAIDAQKEALDRNFRQFIAGLPANNVLLAGSRGCGKSSLIKAALPRYADKGLRLVEVDRADLIDLPEITAHLAALPQKFILFADDLSFESGDAAYKPLKAALDGSVAALPANVLICATSNRRHLMPEFFAENAATQHLGGEVRPDESIEEKISLSDRFGLILTFYPFDQDAYLAIVACWIAALGGEIQTETDQNESQNESRAEALQWAIQRGGRSGRIAQQFARDWVGRQGLLPQ